MLRSTSSKPHNDSLLGFVPVRLKLTVTESNDFLFEAKEDRIILVSGQGDDQAFQRMRNLWKNMSFSPSLKSLLQHF